MSTPSPIPKNTLEHPPRPPKRSVLAKLAATVAAILLIAFGLCTATSMREDAWATVGVISGSIALICFVALIVVGIIAIFRSRI